MATLPLWLIEGMAEYLSVGREDPLTAMWIRDAVRRDEVPTIRQLTRDSRFFPYRFGQALWAYIGGTYGDDAVVEIYRRSLRVGFENAITQVIGMDTDTLSVRWKEASVREYAPLMEGRSAPADQGRLILAPSTGSGSINISPSLSPDGRFVAFLSEKDLFSIELFMADVATGEIIRRLSSTDADPHIQAIRYIDSSGAWSPDSRFFAYVVTAEGDNQLVIAQSDNGQVTQRLSFETQGIGALVNPAWSPDGRYIAFSGSVGGISDLFLYDLEAGTTTRLTEDKYADLQPAWSPDGRTLAFTSDRGPETNFANLTYSEFQLATIDIATRNVRVIPVFGNVKHTNPQYSGDGSRLYFVSDQDGFIDIYELELGTGSVARVTNLATGVSGHTSIAPAMSVAGNVAAYTVFDEREFHIYTVELGNAQPVTIEARADQQLGRRLPPASPDRFSRVATYLADARTGLLPEDTFDPADAESYSSGLSLDYLGQPTIGVGTDTYGNYVGGGTSAFFSDMLGDKSLSVAIQAQGTFKDIGGVAFYSDLDDRWNWGVGGGRIPYLIPYAQYNFNDADCVATPGCAAVLEWIFFRQFVTTGMAQVAYPFSQTQRFELAAGATRYSYDIEVDKIYLNSAGFGFDQRRVSEDAPPALNMFSASTAIVGDNSAFGFVSPIRGQRYRFEVEQTFGTVDFTTVVADYRRYFSPTLNLTLGFRALHFGRYGVPEGNGGQGTNFFFGGPLTPLFVGYETLVRGYSWESFDANECVPDPTQTSNCPTVDRLIGNRIGVTSLEMRIPLLGVEQYGLINFPFVPTELVFFTDAGLAWDPASPTLEWRRSSNERVPVASSGVSARFNVLGILILEAYYAYPWQRPVKGWHWGFQLAPGW
jgi:Tol biopolymer transport system component